jgi:hypothetical protein
MTTFMTKRKIILAKEEAVYNTDPTPTTADNAIDAYDVKVNYQSDVLERNILRYTLSPVTPVIGKRYIEVQFGMELKNGGTAGTASRIGDLLQACGFTETVSAGSSVTYTPASDSHKSITLYVYDCNDAGSAVLHKVTGARGNVSFDITAGQIAMANFQFQGFYNTASDVTRPTGMAYETTKPPIVESASMSFSGVSTLCVQNVSIEMANELQQNECINASGAISEFAITGRKPNGTMNPEMTSVATIDLQSLMLTPTESVLSIALGSTAGNKITFSAPKVTIDNISAGDKNGILVNDLPIRFNQSSGDDELSIKFW